MKKLLFLIYLSPLFSLGAKYYVSSSTGSTTNTGTSPGSPWPSIAWLNTHATLAGGDSVFLRSGDTFSEPLILKFGGSAAAHIVFSTYSGTVRAIISGFYTLTGGTQMGTSNIYEFYCPGLTQRTNMLVMDGIPQAMGRWPDTGYRTYTVPTSNTITDASIPASPNWAGAYLVNHSEFYIIDTNYITSQNAGGLITVRGSFSATNVNRGNGYFIENDPRTLQLTTVAGRWYNNYTKDSMEVYLPGGLGSHVLQVPVQDSLCYFNQLSYNDVYNLDFEGSNTYTVLFNHTTGLTMTNCLFRYGGGSCFLGNECPGTVFTNDTLNYFQNNGASITGSTSLHCVGKNMLINHTGLLPGMGVSSGGNGNKSYTGWYFPFGNSTWQNMTILNTGYVGICYGGDSVNLINCVVDTFCVTKVDGGAYYTTDPSFITYTYGRKITNCMALHGQRLYSGTPYDATDESFGFYCDSHSQSVTLTGCTGAYNISGGLFIHGSKITSYGNNYYGNGFTQRFVSETSGVPVTGLSLKKDQISSSGTGQFLSVFITPGTDLSSFGTVDSNYFAKTDTLAFYYRSNGGTIKTVALPSWQTATGYDMHSSFLSVPATLYYNTGSSSMAEPVRLSDLAGNPYNTTITVPAFSSLILYLKNP
jgi:hypothetical protein